MKLCLCMIVRDEEAVIERALASARAVGIDRWVIVDTGSTDRTPELVEAALEGIPGELHRRPWVNFGHNRTELLDLVREGASDDEYALCLDADMEVEFGAAVDAPHTDSCEIAYRGDLSYRQPLLIRSAKPWRYVGATHEYLNCDEPFTREPFDGLTITHGCDGSRRPEKFTGDQALLEAEIRRPLLYLANTLRDLGQTERARRLYLDRAEQGGWDEEVFYALWQAGEIEGDELLTRAWEMKPDRLEPLCSLAARHMRRGHYRTAWALLQEPHDEPPEGLFVDRTVWEWGLDFNRSVTAWYVGERDLAAELNERLLGLDLPDHVRATVKANAALIAA